MLNHTTAEYSGPRVVLVVCVSCRALMVYCDLGTHEGELLRASGSELRSRYQQVRNGPVSSQILVYNEY